VSEVLRFEGCELDPAARELRNESGTVHVEQQVFDVLLHLAEHRDRVVSKTELLDEVWGDRFVSEAALTSRIKSARQAVGDSGDRQQVIKTIHGVGYRFVAEVDLVQRQRPTGGSPNLDPRIRFVEAAGGVSLAVAETGEGPYLVRQPRGSLKSTRTPTTVPFGGIGFEG
jgi:DNA-binding winged helix-turn-helix (wHTH) protein